MKTPDELVVGIERSIFGRALLISIIVHVVLIGGTSMSLYKDWAKYGFHAPSYINAVKTQENREAEEARRKAAAEEKAAKEAAKAEEMKAIAATNGVKKAGTAKSAAAGAAKAATPAAVGEAKDKTPPELEPLPPKKDFEYGEDLSLD